MNTLHYKSLSIMAIIFLLNACTTTEKMKASNIESEVSPKSVNQTKYYSVILLEVTDQQKYAEYRKLSNSIFHSAGCYIERELNLKQTIQGTVKVGTPNRAIVTYCNTPKAFVDLGKNKDYLKIKPMMIASTSGFTFISGKSLYSGASSSPIDERLYIIKISYFNNKPHQAELTSISAKLESYGFHAENTIKVNDTFGIKKPDEIDILYFDKPSQQNQMYQDKDLMNDINGFNKKYTNGFVYLEGTSI